MKTNASGDSLWAKTYFEGMGKSVKQTTDGGYVITGSLYKSIEDAGPGESPDKYTLVLIKTNSLGEIYPTTNLNDISTKSTITNIYPNPTTGNIYWPMNANIVLTDILGNVLIEKKNTKQLDISAQPAGMYLLRVGENLKQTFKIIKE